MQSKLNNEGETPRQEKVEPVEPKAMEKAEVKAHSQAPKPGKSMYDVKPGEALPHESKFKK